MSMMDVPLGAFLPPPWMDVAGGWRFGHMRVVCVRGNKRGVCYCAGRSGADVVVFDVEPLTACSCLCRWKNSDGGGHNGGSTCIAVGRGEGMGPAVTTATT